MSETANHVEEDISIENDSEYEEDHIFDDQFSLTEGRNILEHSEEEFDHDDEEFYDQDEEEFEYRPGDLINLRGLFDENNTSEQKKFGTTVEFEEIPDDIDLDDPIEVEELSRAGKIMNVVVKAALIIFALLVIGFIINAGLVVGAVLSANYQSKIFVNISGLENEEATINVTIKTEVSHLGRFIAADLDRTQPVKVHVFMPSIPEQLKENDLILEAEYPEDKKSPSVYFNGGVEQAFHLEGIKMRLNPNFNSSRFSGFIEPKIDGKLHERYPRKLIIYLSADIIIHSFWIPIPYPLSQFFEVPLDIFDEESTKAMTSKMNNFDFNPKFVEILPIKDDKDIVKLHVRQPVPKFYAPPSYEVAIQIPELEMDVNQFTMKNPEICPDLLTQFKDSDYLAKIKIRPFRMIVADDMNPNIIDIDAEFSKKSSQGVINVLKAVRDNKFSTLAFLFLSADYKEEKLKSSDDPAVTDNIIDTSLYKPELKISSCNFVEFMRTFWGRQAYPISDNNINIPLPSLPELYDPLIDSAVHVKFEGVKIDIEEDNRTGYLDFRIIANNHYVITQYKLPLRMISGEIPALNFKMVVVNKRKDIIKVASFRLKHFNPILESEPKLDCHPFGREIIFDLSVKFDDLKYLIKLALKLYRMQQAKSLKLTSIQEIVGAMFKNIETAEIVADENEENEKEGDWISQVTSVFNLKFDLTGDLIKFVYSGNGLEVIPESTAGKNSNYISSPAEIEAKKEEYRTVVADINKLLGIVSLDLDLNSQDYKIALIQSIEELKKTVNESDLVFLKSSQSKEDLSAEAAKICLEEICRNDKNLRESIAETNNASSLNNVSCKPHKKLEKVRELLIKRAALIQNVFRPDFISQNSVVTSIDSKKRKVLIDVSLSLNRIEKSLNDHLKVEWCEFEFSILNEDEVELGTIKFMPSFFELDLIDGQIYHSKSSQDETDSKIQYIQFQANIGPKKDDLNLDDWMKKFKSFFSNLLKPSSKIILFYLEFKLKGAGIRPAAGGSVLWSGIFPAAGIPAISLPIPVPDTEPGFFDNLTRSHFDFIGYGFYRLIFKAILPNPEQCPFGRSIFNVELNLPPVTAFLFASAKTGNLNKSKGLAAVNTAQNLRIWTQIVDGVLCNMYAVADGLEEQEQMTQDRISRERSKLIIEDFESVLKLRKSLNINVKKSEHVTKSEHPLKNYEKNSVYNPLIFGRIPLEKRIALITSVPVNIEILNFDYLIQILDAFGDKKQVKLCTDNPKISDDESKDIPLLNYLISSLGSHFPLKFNTPEELKKSLSNSEANDFKISKDKIALNVDLESSSPNELKMTAQILMPDRISTEKNESEKMNYVHIHSESLSPEVRYLHPVIRWGDTTLRFIFPQFFAELKFSNGNIQITNNGEKVIFDALKDLTISLKIKAHDAKYSVKDSKKKFTAFKEIFKTTSIRQVFKRCQDFINKEHKHADDGATKAKVIKTTSRVFYDSPSTYKFHFVGQADIDSFFLIQGAIIRRIFADSGIKNEDYDPRDDPTYIDFGLLISMARNRNGQSSNDRSHAPPELNLPCFFTNFCSDYQLNFASKELLKAGDYLSLDLHVRNTFQPLTAAIASGFSAILTLFYFENYPEFFELNLTIPKDQVIGIEFNGEGTAHGKIGVDVKITKTAEIPYPSIIKFAKKKLKHRYDGILDDIFSDPPSKYLVNYSDRDKFEKMHYPEFKTPVFSDEEVIPVKLQVSDSLPSSLLKLTWPLFKLPYETMTLHPPIIRVEDKEPFELMHAPMSIAFSDSVVYKDNDKKITKPSLLMKFFAAFIEESSNSGIDLHNQKISEPSSFRLNYAIDRYTPQLVSDYFRKSNDESVHIIIWMQFYWGLGSIGFDLGDSVTGKISLPGYSKDKFADIQISRYKLIGTTGRMRIDVNMSMSSIRNISPLIKPFLVLYGKSLNPLAIVFRDAFKDYDWANLGNLIKFIPYGQSTLPDIKIKADFLIDENFTLKTEATLPSKLFSSPTSTDVKLTSTDVELTPTKKNVDRIIQKYKGAPQAVACIYNLKVSDKDKQKQVDFWNKLDLSMSRVFYAINSAPIPGEQFDLFVQLRTVDQIPICGILNGVQTLAALIEYIEPVKSIEILFDRSNTSSAKMYFRAYYCKITSIFKINKISLKFPGRYRIYLSLVLKSTESTEDAEGTEGLKNLKYKQIKFTEIYVKNFR